MAKSLKIIFVLLAIYFSACNQDSDNDYYEKLQGDWIHTVYPDGFLTFKDSLVSIEYTEHFAPYYVENDTIFIGHIRYGAEYNVEDFHINYRFPIEKITDKYMWFKDDETNKIIPRYYSTNKYYYEKIYLQSIEVKFYNDGFRGLFNWSLYIDQNLDSYFRLDDYFENYRKRIDGWLALPYAEGNYFAQITPKEFEYIQNKIQRIPFSELKKEYHSDWYYDYENTYIDLKIVYGVKDYSENKVIRISSKGYRDLPGPVGVLVNYLHEIHFFVNFEKTDQLHDFEL